MNDIKNDWDRKDWNNDNIKHDMDHDRQKEAAAKAAAGIGLMPLILIGGAAALGYYYLSKPQNRRALDHTLDEYGVKDAASRVLESALGGYDRVRDASMDAGHVIGEKAYVIGHAASEGARHAADVAREESGDIRGAAWHVADEARNASRDVAHESRNAKRDVQDRAREKGAPDAARAGLRSITERLRR